MVVCSREHLEQVHLLSIEGHAQQPVNEALLVFVKIDLDAELRRLYQVWYVLGS